MGYMTDFVSLPLPIFKYSFPQLITMETCKEYRKSFPQSNTSNVKAWHTSFDTHNTTDVFDPLIKQVTNACSDITKDYYRIDLINGYHVDDLWLAMYEKNDNAIVHHHFPASFAACYYVDVEDDCSPITFGAHDELSIQPETGMLLVWIALLPHRVAPTKKKRTCISMNISMRSK
tara:strand:- start:3395 stop:3919 length:525 start_codon:yes stop_codon:yes gene_type:complete